MSSHLFDIILPLRVPAMAYHSSSIPDGAFATQESLNVRSSQSDLSFTQSIPSSKTVDPYALFTAEMAHIHSSIPSLLGLSHPKLSEIAAYYFQQPSKLFRPLLVLLFSQATNGLGSHFPLKLWLAEHSQLSAEQLDAPFSRVDTFMPHPTASFGSPFEVGTLPTGTMTYPSPPPALCSESAPLLTELTHTLLPTQLRLAQIVEMLHVATLLHDDVIDESPLRRGAPSAPATFGNKMTVLAGDFLMSRISAALCTLGDTEVVGLIASSTADITEGEILQMESEGHKDDGSLIPSFATSEAPDRWNVYFKKTYLKAASLMAKGVRAAVVLGGCREGEVWKEVAYAYGRNLGMAFQLIDDILDFSPSKEIGKMAGADLHSGFATAPVLYAAEEYPELEPLIARGFSQDGDVEQALSLIHASSGISRTRDLAHAFAQKAKEVLSPLPASEAKDALEAFTERVVRRTC